MATSNVRIAQVKEVIQSRAEDGNQVAASIMSLGYAPEAAIVDAANAETYALSNGQTLTVKVDHKPPETVTFNTGDFADIANATADEVAIVISEDLTEATCDPVSQRPRITTNTRGKHSAVQITGGTANGALGFPTSIKTGSDGGDPLSVPDLGVQERGQSWGPGFLETLIAGVLDAVDLPKGTILHYVGSVNDIAPGWQIADGTNGTTDLRGLFLRGAQGGPPPVIGDTGPVDIGVGAAAYYTVILIQKIL